MYRNKKILAVIPARANSKGIPQKNLKPIRNKPLIFYVLEKTTKSSLIDTVVVSTDSLEIKHYVNQYFKKVIVRDRDPQLAGDLVTLDSVIYDSALYLKTRNFDYVITVQPTSPLVSVKSIDNSIQLLVDNRYDTVLSVVDDRHLRWTIRGDTPAPLYSDRLNRQQLPGR